jgi:hypothetical protein
MRAATVSMRLVWATLCVVALALLQGCAHPISLNPDLAAVKAGSVGKIDRKVGFYIGDDDRKREVTTPGGGGDKVSYFPYRDMETGLYVALSESFTTVTRVTGPADPRIKAEGLNYVISPVIKTQSSSPSPLTWPPTVFTVELTCRVTDPDGKPVSEVKSTGTGNAEFSEFKGNHSLSAKRAVEDALNKLKVALTASRLAAR